MGVRARIDEFSSGNRFAARTEEMSATWHAEFQPMGGGDADGSGSVDRAVAP
jgi:hypothetical protein